MKTIIIALCLVNNMHPASEIVLDDFVAGKTSVEQFQRDFSLPSSAMLQYTECVVAEVAQIQIVQVN